MSQTVKLGVHMHTLLKRVVKAGKAECFQLFAVCPTDSSQYLAALECLCAIGWAVRVSEGCGKWHYVLTAEGRAGARKRSLPRLPATWTKHDDE